MSRIDDLIQRLCPNGVPYQPINKVFNLRNGYTPSKSNPTFWSGGDIPWFRMEDLRANGGILNHSLQQIPSSAVKGGRLFPANSLLVATSATIGEHALITVPHLSNQRFTSLSLKRDYLERLDMKFVYYYGFKLDEWCLSHTTTSSFSSVDMSGFKQFCVPMPPLEVQEEVVRILDSFTSLEAELEAELEARKKQYEYYRDQLLTFRPESGGGVRFMSLSELGSLFGGLSGKSKADFGHGGSRFVSYSNVFNHISVDLNSPDYVQIDQGERQNRLRRGDILFTGSSETPDEVAMSSVVTSELHEPLYLNSFTIGFRLTDPVILDSDFSKHLFRSSPMREQLVRTANGVTRFNVSKPSLYKIKVPVPQMHEQKHIAATLDKFDSLVNDLSSGLPAEIAARRRQHEFYRDRLLSFKELAI